MMLSQLDLAVPKDCDGVSPANMDGFDDDNGIDLIQVDGLDYVNPGGCGPCTKSVILV